MKKVHIVRWSGNQRIDAVHSDYEKACEIVKNSNEKLSWIFRLTGDKWVVQTFDVKD